MDVGLICYEDFYVGMEDYNFILKHIQLARDYIFSFL
jgi:hypothetical protein